MNQRLLMGIAFLNGCILIADFYYPVAVLHNTENPTLLCLYQKANRTTSLHSYTLSTHTTIPLLPEIFNPKEIRLIPDESGFSFIDNGRLRIKYFNKRWPHSCEFDLPIHTIQWVRWLTPEQYLFNAQQHGTFGIYLGTIDDCCVPLYHTLKADCVFPTIIDNDLFFIMRDTQQHYAIGRAQMPSDQKCIEVLYALEPPNKPLITQCSRIIDYNEPIAFLTMIDSECGFFIAYPQKAQGVTAEFKYIKLLKLDNGWKTELLFSFSIPLSYINPEHEDYLVESLLPVMPLYDDDKILFLDGDTDTTLRLFSFDLVTHSRIPLIPDVLNNRRSAHLYLSYIRPICANNTIICGYND